VRRFLTGVLAIIIASAVCILLPVLMGEGNSPLFATWVAVVVLMMAMLLLVFTASHIQSRSLKRTSAKAIVHLQ
jgi:Na+/melibiose symporter-like transporter